MEMSHIGDFSPEIPIWLFAVFYRQFYRSNGLILHN